VTGIQSNDVGQQYCTGAWKRYDVVPPVVCPGPPGEHINSYCPIMGHSESAVGVIVQTYTHIHKRDGGTSRDGVGLRYLRLRRNLLTHIRMLCPPKSSCIYCPKHRFRKRCRLVPLYAGFEGVPPSMTRRYTWSTCTYELLREIHKRGVFVPHLCVDTTGLSLKISGPPARDRT